MFSKLRDETVKEVMGIDAPVTSSGLGKKAVNSGGLGKERDCSQSTVY